MDNNVDVYSHLVKKDIKLFDYLKNELILSLRQTNALMKRQLLLVNDKVMTKNITIKRGDIITINFQNENVDYEGENMPLEIIYESDDLLMINKPPHILVHPTKNHSHHTIANGVSYYFQKQQLKRKVRFVNRLDRDTSGILIIAKNPYSHGFLSKQFERGQIEKKYLAIVTGRLEKPYGLIKARIKKSSDNIKYEINPLGKPSKTLYRVIKEYDTYSLVECDIKSGRTHQIRLALKKLGHYILGDSLYFEESDLINRQALHAYKLEFIEPRTFKRKEIICEIPQDMKKLL